MALFDLHTHREAKFPNIISIQNVYPNQLPDIQELPATFSCGVHPWFITPDNLSQQISQIRLIADHPSLLAFGESGLDYLCQTPIELQKEAFRSMIELSETYKKPLIIHCVRAYAALLELHKKTQHKQPWIIHGFRGKPTLAKQLLQAGFYLSFGKFFQKESVQITPIDHLLIETDEAADSLSTIYQSIATIKQCSSIDLANEINKQAKRLFSPNKFGEMFKK